MKFGEFVEEWSKICFTDSTYRLVGGKYQMHNDTSDKAKKDKGTHCFSFFVVVGSNYCNLKFFSSKNDLKERKTNVTSVFRNRAHSMK